MVWPLIIGAAVSVVGDSQKNNAGYKDQIGQNKAIREANLANTGRVGFQVGLLNIQRGQRLRQASQARADLSQAEILAASESGNNAAASGTVGASVDAVQMDVQLQFERARAELDLGNEMDALNFNTALHDLIQGGQDSLIDPVKTTGMSDAAIVGKAVVSAVGTYYSDKMQLGLGKSNAPTQAAPAASFRR